MRLFSPILFLGLGLAVLARPAKSAIIIDVTQVGSNVVATGGGTADLTDLTLNGSTPAFTAMEPNVAGLVVGPGATGFSLYENLVGPASFGPGGYTTASSGSGSGFGINGSGFNVPYLYLPAGYGSGTALSGSATYDGQTFASLGLTPGAYTWTWGSGADADSLTVNIGAVPEPMSASLLAAGIAGLGFAGRRRSRTTPNPTRYQA